MARRLANQSLNKCCYAQQISPRYTVLPPGELNDIILASLPTYIVWKFPWVVKLQSYKQRRRSETIPCQGKIIKQAVEWSGIGKIASKGRLHQPYLFKYRLTPALRTGVNVYLKISNAGTIGPKPVANIQHTAYLHVLLLVILTSSSAVAKRPRDASCLSVVSYISTKRRVESFIVSLQMRAVKCAVLLSLA